MANNIVETLIGAVVLIIAVFFVVFAYLTTGDTSTRSGYELSARFTRVDGLATGSDVRMSGIKIGTVIDQTLDTTTFDAIVRMSISDDVRVPDDTAVKIGSDGLLGDAYISLEPGGSEELLEDGGELEFTQGSVNLMDLIAQAVFGAAGAKDEGARQ